MRSIFSRGQSLQFRFVFSGVIAIAIVIADSYFDAFSKIRIYMDTVISPFYFISNAPKELFNFILQTASSHNQLKLENHTLRKKLLLNNSELLMLEHYKQENTRLRELLGSPLCQNEKKIVTRIISIINNPYSDQVVIDKGSVNGVCEGQPVISDKGIVGQVISVSKFTSRVLLICDTTHALPIQVLRNGMRVIAFGNGCASDLKLELLPIEIDIHVGDILVTSGLGGRFPEGYPVAVVTSIKLDTQRSCASIQARPTEDFRNLRYVLLCHTDCRTLG